MFMILETQLTLYELMLLGSSQLFVVDLGAFGYCGLKVGVIMLLSWRWTSWYQQLWVFPALCMLSRAHIVVQLSHDHQAMVRSVDTERLV